MSRDPSGRRWSRIFKPDARVEVEDELAFHLEQRVRDNIARGMDPDTARAAAQQRLGELDSVRNECTRLLQAERRSDARSYFMKMSWLDFKLGFRLLVRYPGLTLVGGLAMAFAIAVGAGAFEVVKQMVDPRLPLEEGDRIVAIHNFHTRVGEVFGQSLQDFALWRDEVESIDDLGAFRTIERNLILGVGQTEPVSIAEISASAFRVARVRPLLGRTLIDADEQPGAAPVVVIGYDIWQTRFAGDPNVVGRIVQLGGTHTTIAGVMPDGFAFPVAHKFWIPLRPNADYAGGDGRGIHVFGRLARGVTRERAQAELTTIGTRSAAAYPETHRDLTPKVVPYALDIRPADVPHGLEPVLYAINLFFVMLLVLICANVALLMFARAATRESEIVVRNALGASRGRIITQLFAEALVLGVIAAVIGLAGARIALTARLRVSQLESDGGTPFWFDDSTGPATLLYTAVLTILTAAIVGVVPALKMTGRRVEGNLRQLAAGSGGLRFGRVWTLVIIAQVAFTVAFPATAFFARRYVVGFQTLDLGFAAREYLSVRLELDRAATDTASEQFLAKVRATSRELERRLVAEPAVAGVTFTNRLPSTYHPQHWVETDPGGAAVPQSSRGHPITNARVDLDYFDVLGAPILAGRGFHSGDLEGAQNLTGLVVGGSVQAESRVVVVNQSFVDRVLGGRNPLGRRVRYDGDGPRPWYEIVGVVKDLGLVADNPDNGAGLYHPVAAAFAPQMYMAIHVRGEAASFAPRFRTIAAAVDPTLRLHEILPMDTVGSSQWLELNFLFKLLVGLSAIALILSLAGIYSVTSFTVSRRTREIGIRVALGADPRRVIAAIFARPVAQVAIGILAGGWMTGMLAYGIMRGALWPKGVVVVVVYAALMMGVCMLACVVPTRRALRIQPTEALRADG
ncbi:MAG: ABC transporter permease [Gemmatimonadota bacterium]